MRRDVDVAIARVLREDDVDRRRGSARAAALVEDGADGFGGRGAAKDGLPLTADGAIAMTKNGVSVKARLSGAAAIPGVVTDGYVVYAGAAPGGGSSLMRPTGEGVEDFVVYEVAPSQPEADYVVDLDGVAGLRLVDNVVEFLDADGAPRLRARAPFLVDATQAALQPTVTIVGCAVDTSGAAPWGRTPQAPGATSCAMHISWSGLNVSYPAILDPAWTTTSSMVEPRTKHTAAAIATPSGVPRGRALIYGGLSGAGALVGAEIYDPETDTWASTSTPVQKRSDHVMVLLQNGKVLAAGGSAAGAFLSSAEVYDPIAGTWTAVGTMALGRRFASAEVLPNGKVLVAGGWIQSTNNYTNAAELFDPTTSAWSSTGSMATARGEAMSAMLNTGKILVAGGAASTSSSTNLASAEAYNQATGSWSSAGTMTSARFRAAIARTPANQKVIVAGGATSGTALATATTDVYDPVANSWSNGSPMTTPRMSAAFALLPGSVLLVSGGTDGSTPLSSVEAWDTLSGYWALDDSTQQTRSNVPATVLYTGTLSRVLVAGLSTRGFSNGELRAPDHALGESTTPYAVNVDWSNTNLTGSLTSSTNIAGIAKNVSTSSLSVQIFTRAFGLDQRTVRRSVGTFTIAAGGTKNFNVLVSALPIQSVGMQSQVQLEAEYTPSGGTATVVASPMLHYQFASGYASAIFTGWGAADDAVTTPVGMRLPRFRRQVHYAASFCECNFNSNSIGLT